jgi:hypothetical protein
MKDEKEIRGELAINDGAIAMNIISWIVGIVFLGIGIVNTFWGDDTGFGVFIVLISFVYFLPVNAILRKMTGFSIPGIRIVKVLLGIFIIWAAMGVGELFDKIELIEDGFFMQTNKLLN